MCVCVLLLLDEATKQGHIYLAYVAGKGFAACTEEMMFTWGTAHFSPVVPVAQLSLFGLPVTTPTDLTDTEPGYGVRQNLSPLPPPPNGFP